jgi:hypothetical protein
MAEPKLVEILRILSAHRVDFIVVGGMAAVIGGVPVVTRDIDVLPARSSANVEHLLAALSELEALFRGDARRLRPNASHLAGPGHLLLETRYGPLDLLGTIEDDTTYNPRRTREERRRIARRAWFPDIASVAPFPRTAAA